MIKLVDIVNFHVLVVDLHQNKDFPGGFFAQLEFFPMKMIFLDSG